MRQCWKIGVILLGVFLTVPVHAEPKLAYVNMQRALNECNAGKRAKAQFRNRVRVLKVRLEKQQREVKALKDELEKKGMLMKEDQRENLAEEYARKLKSFKRAYKDSMEELRRKDSEVTGKIVRDLAQVVRNLGKRDGYTLVMEKGTILWGIPSIDITDAVIREYNSMHVKIGTLGLPRSGTRAGAARKTKLKTSSTRRSTISK